MTFWGVRGSTPCPAEQNQRYGGNTSCVSIEDDGADPIVLDLGTGLRLFGQEIGDDGIFTGHALITHVHWDHVQGLPFFVPVLRDGACLDVYGPPPGDRTLRECFETFIAPPFFPVHVDHLPGTIRFHDIHSSEVAIGSAKVTARPVPHVGNTNGYRIEQHGAVVAYVSDHQMPGDGSHRFPDEVLELARDADLLIHDAQYTPEEFATKRDWGHCTVQFAVDLAIEAGVSRLALFHHDPSHDDDEVDRLLCAARERAGDRLDEVIAAAEGTTIVL